MIVKGLVDEDFVNYKIPSMFIGFPKCTFKCDKECGEQVCQNSILATSPDIEVNIEKIIERYISNNITSAIVLGGLEPFDSWGELLDLIHEFRNYTSDPIVIYTGYTEEEIEDKISVLRFFRNIIVKFGRFVPNKEKHFDEILGVWLASDNQYGKVISK